MELFPAHWRRTNAWLKFIGDLAALAVGLVSPPYGICLLIAARIGEVSTPRAFLAILPIVTLVLVVVASLLLPGIFLSLPRLLMPEALGG